MSDDKSPIGIVVGFFLLGLIMVYFFPLVFTTFVEPDEYETPALAQWAIDLLDTEINFLTFDFHIIPSFLRDLLEDFINAWSYVPVILTLLILIPTFIGVIYAFMLIVKDLIPFT